MMKIYTKMIRRKYKRGDPYVYPKYLVPVSAIYNEMIANFLQNPLEENIYIQGEIMHLTLTKQKSEVTQNGKK